MDNGEIGSVGASFSDPQSKGAAFARRPALPEAERRTAPRDFVDLTRPHKAALALLRERVLENTRLQLELPRQGVDRHRFAHMPDARPAVYLSHLISDQNRLAGARRGSWETARVDEAVEAGLVQGMSETMEILYQLGELDEVVWRMVSSVLDEYFRKLFGVSPEEIRDAVWGDIDPEL